LAAVSVVLIGGSAFADQGLAKQRSVAVQIRAEGSNGYKLTIDARSQRRDSAAFELSKNYDKGEAYASAAYEPRGPVLVTANRVRFGLGSLGRVDLRFHERRRHAISRQRCRFGFTQRYGVFRGTLRFDGEDGFSRADLGSARGSVTILRRVGCGSGRSAISPSVERRGKNSAFLIGCAPERNALLVAQRIPQAALAVAFESERTKRARIARISAAVSSSQFFRTRDHLATATLTPPGPLFSGRATYEAGATNGDLEAHLPGAGPVALVPGPAILSRDTRAKPPPCRLRADMHRLSMRIGRRVLRQAGSGDASPGSASRPRISK